MSGKLFSVINRDWATTKNDATAREYYEKALSTPEIVDSQRVKANLNSGRAAEFGQDYPVAQASYAKVLSDVAATGGSRSGAQLYQGDIFRVEKNYPEARAAYEKVLALTDANASHKTTAQNHLNALPKA